MSGHNANLKLEHREVLYEREGFVIEGRKRCERFLDGAEDDILIMGCLRDEWRMKDEGWGKKIARVIFGFTQAG